MNVKIVLRHLEVVQPLIDIRKFILVKNPVYVRIVERPFVAVQNL